MGKEERDAEIEAHFEVWNLCTERGLWNKNSKELKREKG